MYLNLALLAIFLASFLALAFLIWKKMPVLKTTCYVRKESEIIKKAKNMIAENRVVKGISNEVFRQKILSQTRVVVLKTEKKIADLLTDLRQRAIEKKNFSKEYWKHIKEDSEKSGDEKPKI